MRFNLQNIFMSTEKRSIDPKKRKKNKLNINLPVGKVIRNIRIAQRYTQQEVGEKVGVSSNRICEIEANKGYPTHALMHDILAVLGYRISVRKYKNILIGGVPVELELNTDQPIGFIIRDIRKSQRYKQTQIANEVGVTRNRICEIEKGKGYPSHRLLIDILAVLGYRITYEKLLKDSNNK